MSTKIIKEERGRVFYIGVSELWNTDISSWESYFENEGLRVCEAKKVIKEGRGCIKVEFNKTVPFQTVINLTEADVPHDRRPKKQEIYQVRENKEAIFRPQTNTYSRHPISLKGGDRIQIEGSISGNQWMAYVRNGKHSGVNIVISEQEWNRYSPSLKPIGDSNDVNNSYTKEKLDSNPIEKEGSSSKDGNKKGKDLSPKTKDGIEKTDKTSNPFVKKGSYKRVSNDFPEFPKRKPPTAYFNMDLPDEPIGGEGGGGGGGFGGGF